MANRARGEVDITIAGRKYPVAMTLEFIGLAADVVQCETMTDFGARLLEFRPADVRPLLGALLQGNGHTVSPEAIGAVTLNEYIRTMVQVATVSPPGDDPEGSAEDPQKRASQ